MRLVGSFWSHEGFSDAIEALSVTAEALSGAMEALSGVMEAPSRAMEMCQSEKRFIRLKVHKNENFFGFDFEICTFS